MRAFSLVMAACMRQVQSYCPPSYSFAPRVFLFDFPGYCIAGIIGEAENFGVVG